MLRTTCENKTKQLKNRQKIYKTTKLDRKTIKVVIKQVIFLEIENKNRKIEIKYFIEYYM